MRAHDGVDARRQRRQQTAAPRRKPKLACRVSQSWQNRAMMPPLDAILQALALLSGGDAQMWRAVGAALAASVAGLLLAALPALFLGCLLALRRFRGRSVAVWLLQSAQALPLVLIGMLAWRLAPSGPDGGLVLLLAVLAFPLLASFTLAAVQAVDPRHADTALALGASKLAATGRVLHEARFGVTAALAGGFGRVLAESGCALALAGAVGAGSNAVRALALGIALLAFALPVNGLLVLLQGDARVARGRA
jgi:tungstate transport system permease protein